MNRLPFEAELTAVAELLSKENKQIPCWRATREKTPLPNYLQITIKVTD